MNLIMGNMGNGVSQLLTPSATNAKLGGKAGAGEGATLPFSALLTQMATPSAGKTIELPAVTAPVADAVATPALSLADLPLTDLSQPVVEETVVPKTLPQNAEAKPALGPKIAILGKPATAKGREEPKIAEASTIPVSDADPLSDEPSEHATSRPTSTDVIAQSPIDTQAVVAGIPVAPNIQPTAAAKTAPETPVKARGTTNVVQLQPSEISPPPTNQTAAPDAKQAALPPGLAQMVLSEAMAQTEPRAAKKAATPEGSQIANAMPRLTQPDAPVVARRAPVDSVAPVEGRAVPAPDTDAPAAPVGAPSPSTAVVQPTSGTPTVDLAASLGQQVIDMGSDGQWIDGLAREIATLSKSEGHGSFRLSPEHLGPMRVDIRPGEQGANVTLTVETKAAESMLMQDRATLKADAQLAAVRIGEVTVERVANVQEPTRADTATGQGNGGHSQSQTASQGQSGNTGNGAALAQGQGQSGQNGNHAGNRKVFSDPTVSSQAEPRDMGSRDTPDAAHRARYA